MFELELLAWELENQTVKTIFLIFGSAVVISGLVLMKGHRDELESVDITRSRQEESFARRKYYRRMTGSSLISCIGMCLAAMHWVTHPRVFASITLVILCLLVLLFLVAVFDLFNVGIQAIVDPQHEKREELVKEVLRLRKEAEKEKDAQSDSDSKES